MKAGGEETRVTTVRGSRGHAVYRTRLVFPMRDIAPVVLADEKYPHTLRPVSANNAYGTPSVSTCPTEWKPITNATSNAKGWNTSQIGPRIDCLYFTFKSRETRTHISSALPVRSRREIRCVT